MLEPGDPEEGLAETYPRLPFCENEEQAWMYADRRQMQEICSSVYLGPYACAAKSKLAELKVMGPDLGA